MSDDVLGTLPIEVLMALRDAVADPSEEGRARAAARAAEVGVYLHFKGGLPVIEMEPAPLGVAGERLTFEASADRQDDGLNPRPTLNDDTTTTPPVDDLDSTS